MPALTAEEINISVALIVDPIKPQTDPAATDVPYTPTPPAVRPAA